MSVQPLSRAAAPDADGIGEFDDFYRSYYIRVLALIRRHFPACDPEDVAQETLARCFAHFHTLDPRRDPWKWVSSVARNTAIDSMRRSRRTVPTDELPVARDARDETYDAVLRNERTRWVHTALRRMRPSDRQLIEHHDLEGVAAGELAMLRGVSPNTLRQQLHRARARLAVELRRVGASLGVVGASAQNRLNRASRRFNDAVVAAGPAATSAFGVVAAAGIVSATMFAGTSMRSAEARAATAFEPVAPVERVASAHHRAVAVAVRTAPQRHVRHPGPDDPTVPPPPTVTVTTHGDPTKPGEPSGHDIVVETPVGTIEHHHEDGFMPGYGVLCYFGLVPCPEQT